jgi:putative oxidoreductase
MSHTSGFYSLIFKMTYDHRSLFVRVVVGLIFLSEGIQKYLFLSLLGPGRFLQIGFTHPAFWSYFTGTFEIICGAFILTGLLTRLASIPLLIIMVTAFLTTKWPILISNGFWTFAHEYRTDFAMTILLIYLFIYGSGKWSLDSGISRYVQT